MSKKAEIDWTALDEAHAKVVADANKYGIDIDTWLDLLLKVAEGDDAAKAYLHAICLNQIIQEKS